MARRKIEDYLPPIKEDGLNTDKDVRVGGAITPTGGIEVPADTYSISSPPIKFVYPNTTDDESSKGGIIEWGGVMPGTTLPYGIATYAYQQNPAATFSAPTGYKKWAWITAHYDSPASTDEDVHQHLNLETVKADWITAITRFQISFGEDVALVSFPNSHVKVYPDKKFQVGSDATGTYMTHDTTAAEIAISSLANTKWNFKDTTLRLYSAAAGGIAIEGRIGAETINRFSMNTSGRMEWGTGSATRDTNLYRNGTDQLKTDDKFIAGAGVNMGTGVAVPATATSTGTTGDVAYDANFIYICVATNTWKRAALSTW